MNCGVQQQSYKEDSHKQSMLWYIMQFPKSKRRKMKKTTADKWFSIYIRLRGSFNGWCTCITCGCLYHWKKIDCGHFVTRNHSMTRFDERNAHPQCKACNNFKSGNQYKHGKMIDKLYGEGTADELIKLGSIRGQKSYSQLALKDIAKEYSLKAKEMAREKGVEL